ncbi:hypothetical protein POM88_021354 [Heracleum sosnowskyi]|uniref:Uncharacterized protein n=1 Tax=Heracleum sosnowskyi TaxID=360622 RepID=A0AAD8ID75_9APIA|nr:hypothetical protein POM88_021354 [Heracleum sosnowskyi]
MERLVVEILVSGFVFVEEDYISQILELFLQGSGSHGEESPTDGTTYIFGSDIRMNPKAARRHIGYCLQFDALLEFLTVQEHLELYARIKGVPDYDLANGIDQLLHILCMDPIAKRFMWEVISRLSTRQGKTAVILTTHSMNEAQALCTRTGIMVGGRLRCIGSSQHLKTRFGIILSWRSSLLKLSLKSWSICVKLSKKGSLTFLLREGPGFEAYVLDFQIRKNVNSSPDDRKKRLQKSQISLTEERRKRNITLLVEEVMAELEFVTEEDAP